MTLHLPLSSDLEQRLLLESQRHSLAPADYTLQLLSKHLPTRDRHTELVAVLQSWIEEGDAEEQKATGEYLLQALDEDRPSERKLFPSELKGVTW
jgi:hypothetical protein